MGKTNKEEKGFVAYTGAAYKKANELILESDLFREAVNLTKKGDASAADLWQRIFGDFFIAGVYAADDYHSYKTKNK